MGAGQTRAGAQTAATTTARTRAAHKTDSDAIGGAFRSHLQQREVLKFGYVPMGDSASGEGFGGFHVLRYGRGRGLLGRRPPVVAARNETHFAPFATWDPRIGHCKPNVRRLGAKDLQKDGFASQQVWYWSIAWNPSKYGQYMEGWTGPDPSKY
jgi:hypothetical protein